MEISEAILAEWKRQAAKDGKQDEYEYHLGTVYPPLPYQTWKRKVGILKRLQNRPGYQDGRPDPILDADVNRLCRELGY